MTKCALALAGLLLATSACASEYTITDRSSIQVSKNARTSARNLIGDPERYADVAEQLALAQEVYQQQLSLLKERRNKVRSRRRNLNVLSFAALAGSSAGVAGTAIAGNEMDSSANLQAGIALGGLAVGTLLQVTSFMQEDSSSIDAKVRQLDLLYDTMIERLRQLSLQDKLTRAADGSSPNSQAEMATAIESFVGAALAINIKG